MLRTPCFIEGTLNHQEDTAVQAVQWDNQKGGLTINISPCKIQGVQRFPGK